MITFLIVALGAALLAWYLSGARSLAYLLYFIAYVPFLSLDAEAGGMSDLSALGSSNALTKMAIRVATTAALVMLLVRRRETTRALLAGRSMPVLFFFAWALVGLPASQTPMVSLFRLGELLAFFLVGLTLYLESSRYHGPREVARWHCLALLPLLIVALWSIVQRPELAFHVTPTGQGRLGHKLLNANILGFGAVILALWGTHELREERGGRGFLNRARLLPLLVIGAALGVMVLARSRTSLVTLILGQLVLWLPVDRGNPRRRLMFIGLVVAGCVGVLLQLDEITTWVMREGSSADLMSGTGRTELWGALLTEELPRAPIRGAGYLMLGEEGGYFHAGRLWTNAHNTYLFALVATGIPGFLSILAIALLPFRATIRRYLGAPSEERSSWTLILACQTVVLVSGVTGFGICGFPNAVMLFHYALYTWALAPRVAPRPKPGLRLVSRPLLQRGYALRGRANPGAAQ